MTDTVNSLNYMTGSRIFLMGPITDDNTAHLIGPMAELINRVTDYTHRSLRFTDPYRIVNMLDLDQPANPRTLPHTACAAPIIDLFINSRGGTMGAAMALANMLAYARSRNIAIRTTVMGVAGDVASYLAVQGDPQMRIIYENAYHHINIANDMSYDLMDCNTYTNAMTGILKNTYLNTTRLKPKQIGDMLQSTDDAKKYIYSSQALKNRLADWILMSNGQIVQDIR